MLKLLGCSHQTVREVKGALNTFQMNEQLWKQCCAISNMLLDKINIGVVHLRNITLVMTSACSSLMKACFTKLTSPVQIVAPCNEF